MRAEAGQIRRSGLGCLTDKLRKPGARTKTAIRPMGAFSTKGVAIQIYDLDGIVWLYGMLLNSTLIGWCTMEPAVW